MNILISGAQGSGKTALSKGLQGTYANMKCIKFADVLYEMHDKVLEIYNKNKPETYNNITLAKVIMQFIGTEWGRSLSDKDGVIGNIWIDIVKEKIRRNKSELYYFTVIDDLRFKNEFDLVDGVKIRLECPEEIRKNRCSDWRNNTGHASEIDLDEYVSDGKFDLVINTAIRTEEETLQIVKEYIDAHITKGM